ncbi:MAG: response regulator [Candidatus Fibromonas sp.]|jgi:DNA-binding response OmpR family regulator|nr:response regulator [Candidatus Fibromonas sp.]
MDSTEKKILAVDDADIVLHILNVFLRNSQYKLTSATSGRTALNFIQKHSPDLFILDIDMPDMNGYELAQRIRASGQTAPIIFLTGNSTEESIIKALQVGAADFIAKPVCKAKLLERIAKFF